MNTLTTKLLACLSFVSLGAAPVIAQSSNFATSKRNMVASVHPLATQAGVNAFKKGGNAIDAAIATAVTLGVVDGFNSGIGGGCFILLRTSSGALVAIDGREMAPAGAHRDMYLKAGQPRRRASQLGALAIAVPGAVAAYDEAISQFGNLKFSDVLLPAAEIAERGFEVDSVYSNRLQGQLEKLMLFPSTASVLLKEDKTAYGVGEILTQTDLANTYRSIAEHGVSWFYRGPFAEATAAWMNTNGGIITENDMNQYKTKRRAPIRTTYRGFEIVGFPPPSSGGVHVAQILNILETFDLKELHQSSPVLMKHVVAEAMKLAFADRAYWLGDPDFVDVPKQLISKEYATRLATRIDLKSASLVKSHGMPPNADAEFFERHTTHLTAADREGNWIAITSTVNTTFGSKVIIPKMGVVMNNQMDDFSIAPGVPNAFGLIGMENNAIAAGKRPLSSMSPTIVMRNGQPIFTVGAAGGPKIITQAVWAIVNHLDLGMSVPESLAQARLHHQWSPDKLMVEKTTSDSIKKELEKLGHSVGVLSTAGVSQAIGFDTESGIFIGAFDPRIPGKAAGEE